jgi:hypothetical protein
MISLQSTVVADSASSFCDTKINKKISIQSNVDVFIDLPAYLARLMYFRDIFIDYENKTTLLKSLPVSSGSSHVATEKLQDNNDLLLTLRLGNLI